MQFTLTTTRSEWIARLQQGLTANPGNIAIHHHLDKVAAMDEAAFVAHRADHVSSAPARAEAARIMGARLWNR